MELIPKVARERLLANGWRNAELIVKDQEPEDFRPVVKLFCPWGGATWLLTEVDPEDPDIAFGLCDLGMGFPEIGRVSLMELKAVIGPGGLRIERDLWFKPDKTLQGYADEAHELGRITA
jgi:glycine/D-amino acid oxidase-like deaminating enzyme